MKQRGRKTPLFHLSLSSSATAKRYGLARPSPCSEAQSWTLQRLTPFGQHPHIARSDFNAVAHAVRSVPAYRMHFHIMRVGCRIARHFAHRIIRIRTDQGFRASATPCRGRCTIRKPGTLRYRAFIRKTALA